MVHFLQVWRYRSRQQVDFVDSELASGLTFATAKRIQLPLETTEIDVACATETSTLIWES